MPIYRIHVKLEGKGLKEYVVFEPLNDIEYVYHGCIQRANSKNGSGRAEYFDLVMIAETSLLHQADREEVFNPGNNFRISTVASTKRKEKIYIKEYFG